MYARILVPVDDSEASSSGLDEAIAIARSCRGTVRLLHAIDDLSKATAIAGDVVRHLDLVDEHVRAGRAVLAAAAARVARRGVDVETLLIESSLRSVADIAIEQATAWPASLIVVGTHGRRGIDRLLLGSNAETIARGSPVPVLLVRAADGAPASARNAASSDAPVPA